MIFLADVMRLLGLFCLLLCIFHTTQMENVRTLAIVEQHQQLLTRTVVLENSEEVL